MTDIESRVTASLAARADQRIDVHRLREGAIARARVLRRRRRMFGTAGLAGVATVAVLLAGPLAPPVAPPSLGVASALDRPQDIGTDPALLHFDVELGGLDAGSAEWISAGGYERAIIYDATDQQWASVYIAHTQAALDAAAPPTSGQVEQTTVGGRPAALRRIQIGDITWELRWQPTDGVFAVVYVNRDDRALAVTVAEAVRLDRAQRCAVPLRLTELPVGATWTECQTRMRHAPAAGQGVWLRSGVTLRQGDGDRVLIWAEPVEPGGPPTTFQPDRTVAGHPAQWRTADMRGLWAPVFGPIDVFVGGYDPDRADWLTEAEAVWLAERLAVAADLTNPATWPERAVG